VALKSNGRPAADRRTHWTRADLIRQFELPSRQLNSWEKQDLFPKRDLYRFDDLIALRVLLKLRSLGVSSRRMKTAFASIQSKLRDVQDPWREIGFFVDGKKIQVRNAGRKMDAESGQFVLDFDSAELTRLLAFPAAKPAEERANHREAAQRARAEAEACFQRGLEIEQSGADKREAILAYEEALTHNPQLAGALVNLGTIYFNARDWRKSEKYYQSAVEADGAYPLAHFNLANLHEELGRTSLAIQHYKKAIDLAPAYADAHYNLALLYQTRERSMEALRHWKLYLKLDSSSHWASIARRELNRLKDAAVIRNG
jgi:tetratricopeptide (TPR) repeat protein